jgi:hypothetical protein
MKQKSELDQNLKLRTQNIQSFNLLPTFWTKSADFRDEHC